ncbi:MAG: hypothetical protein E7001_05115 [Coriobacteriaceae bacterium]|nr:hypothetical protein [Coriobacteriaceae bacterium]
MSKARIKLCPKCSGIKPGKLVDAGVPKDEIARGCFGCCRKKRPELEDRVYVRVEGRLVSAGSKKKLAKKVVAALTE